MVFEVADHEFELKFHKLVIKTLVFNEPSSKKIWKNKFFILFFFHFSRYSMSLITNLNSNFIILSAVVFQMVVLTRFVKNECHYNERIKIEFKFVIVMVRSRYIVFNASVHFLYIMEKFVSLDEVTFMF